MLTISIVSHGHGEMIRDLLADLAPLVGPQVTIVVTVNVPEPETFLEGHTVAVVRNHTPKGFGSNHNQAFRLYPGEFLAVLNPDVRCDWRAFHTLVDLLRSARIGVCGPVIRNPMGGIEDSARVFPSLGRIASRVLSRSLGLTIPADYPMAGNETLFVDWIAGMFMVFPSAAFREVAGFDEGYHMYMEDADICYRLRKLGWSVAVARSLSAVHDARRATLKDFKHLRWHVASLIRFLARVGFRRRHQASASGDRV